MSEPFGYFKAEPFGWTDCAETDEGAVALYQHPKECKWPTCQSEEYQQALAEQVQRELVGGQPALHQKPVALKWQQAPIRTAWGNEMVVASVAIDNDHTLSLYCERDQTPKVEAMLAQRTWTGLTDVEIEDCYGGEINDFARAIEAKLREKNQ